MLIHHPLAIFHGQGVPCTSLDKGIDEEIFLIFRRNHQTWVMSTTSVFTHIDRTFGHGKKGVRLTQVRPHGTTPDTAGQSLQVFNSIRTLPEHEVTIGTQAKQAKATHQRFVGIFLIDTQKLLFALLARLSRQQLPLRIKFIEGETHQLAWLLWFGGCFCLFRRGKCCLFCHMFYLLKKLSFSSCTIASTRPSMVNSLASI